MVVDDLAAEHRLGLLERPWVVARQQESPGAKVVARDLFVNDLDGQDGAS